MNQTKETDVTVTVTVTVTREEQHRETRRGWARAFPRLTRSRPQRYKLNVKANFEKPDITWVKGQGQNQNQVAFKRRVN